MWTELDCVAMLGLDQSADDLPAVLIPGWMHEHAVDVLTRRYNVVTVASADEIVQLADDGRLSIVALACRTQITARMMDALPNLRIICSYGVGFDAIDIDAARHRGIVVTNTPDVLTEDVADTAVGLLINVVRELSRAEAYLRAGRWVAADYPLSRLTLRNRKVGIYGMGRIGQSIAQRLVPFGLQISYHNRRQVEGLPYAYFSSLIEMARAVDTLISVVPGGAGTELTINDDVLSALGEDGVLINLGRGSVLDEEALVRALKSNTIAAAGLDVYSSEPDVSRELLDAPNLTLLPHIGSASAYTRKEMADLLARNVISWIDRGVALTAV
jgi:lactate dehydrogenase-like 2-hydroxyacid dehydrogenase